MSTPRNDCKSYGIIRSGGISITSHLAFCIHCKNKWPIGSEQCARLRFCVSSVEMGFIKFLSCNRERRAKKIYNSDSRDPAVDRGFSPLSLSGRIAIYLSGELLWEKINWSRVRCWGIATDRPRGLSDLVHAPGSWSIGRHLGFCLASHPPLISSPHRYRCRRHLFLYAVVCGASIVGGE